MLPLVYQNGQNMWQTNEILVLSYATINFKTQEITWQPSGFSAKRRLCILNAFKAKSVDAKWLENAI
jgi:hypothetical protein